MTTTDWEEVKKLAADFQKAQLSFTSQKLSERNCIEIVMKLREKHLIDVIITNDGKEYVTPHHLSQEIKDEVYVHGGRINLVDLAKILNVDLSQINKLATDIEKSEKKIKLVLGNLIDPNYILKIAEEINDNLNQNGYINVAVLALHYDLPADFLQSVIEKHLGKVIRAKQDSQDSKIFYNEGYIARNQSKIRGALSALTRPTPISAILGQCGVSEKIFFSILENMREVPGVITGKHSTGMYVPTIYSKTQNEYINNFFKQNGYLEYDSLTRLGISDPKSLIKRHFVNEHIIFLDTVAVGTAIIDQVDANIEEIVATNSFLDLCPLLPSVFSPEDIEILIKESISKLKSPVIIFTSTVIVSESFLKDIHKNLEPLAEKKAKEMVDSGKWQQLIISQKLKSKTLDIVESRNDKKSERKKKSGKSGGGAQGREIKVKSTKKKYLQDKNSNLDSDDEKTCVNSKSREHLVTLDDVKQELEKNENLSIMEEFISELAAYFQTSLNKHASEIADNLSQKHKTTNLNEIEDRLNSLFMNIKVFDKGIKCLDKNIQGSFIKYLLKTLCTDFVTELFKLAAQQNVVQCTNTFTTETRQKMLLDFPEDIRQTLGDLHKSLMSDVIDDFVSKAESAMAACCLLLRKSDKKKERLLVVGHREGLLEQLNNTRDPALVLHLCSTILFIAATQNALHMSGKHVSIILKFLQPYLLETTNEILMIYHDQVLKFLSSVDDTTKIEIQQQLEENVQKIKSIANEYKKQLRSDKIKDN